MGHVISGRLSGVASSLWYSATQCDLTSATQTAVYTTASTSKLHLQAE